MPTAIWRTLWGLLKVELVMEVGSEEVWAVDDKTAVLEGGGVLYSGSIELLKLVISETNGVVVVAFSILSCTSQDGRPI